MKLKVFLFIYILLSCINPVRPQYHSASFYMSAHPDDWQLFMGVNAFQDIADSANKVVIIYMTAGDKGFGDLPRDAYYLARQNGADRSVKFCVGATGGHAVSTCDSIKTDGMVGTHNILRSSCRNVVSYFLRLPDGCFECCRCNTLSKLAYSYGYANFFNDYKGVNFPVSLDTSCMLTQYLTSELKAVDQSTIYCNYQDLVETIRNIMITESQGVDSLTLHAPDYDPEINPGDHPDHVQTGIIAGYIAESGNPCMKLLLHQDYHSCSHPVNLNTEQIAMEAALQSQVSFGITNKGWDSEWDNEVRCGHVDWTSRNYFREGPGCGLLSKSKSLKNLGKKYPSRLSESTDLINGELVTLTPNPVADIATVSLYMAEKGLLQIRLSNEKGTLCMEPIHETKNQGLNQVRLNVGSLKTGLYTLSVITPGYTHNLKFSKL